MGRNNRHEVANSDARGRTDSENKKDDVEGRIAAKKELLKCLYMEIKKKHSGYLRKEVTDFTKRKYTELMFKEGRLLGEEACLAIRGAGERRSDDASTDVFLISPRTQNITEQTRERRPA